MSDPFVMAQRKAILSTHGIIDKGDLSSGDNILDEVANQSIEVYRYKLTVDVACVLEVWNGPISDNNRIDVIQFAGPGGISEPLEPLPYWVTSPGKELVFSTDVVARVTGSFRYRQG